MIEKTVLKNLKDLKLCMPPKQHDSNGRPALIIRFPGIETIMSQKEDRSGSRCCIAQVCPVRVAFPGCILYALCTSSDDLSFCSMSG